MNLKQFNSRDAASRAAADDLAGALRRRLEKDERAALIVSGGNTPVGCLNLLSQAALPWQRVMVSVTDERCVAASHAASNERMVRENLLRDSASAARYVGLEEAVQAEFSRHIAAALVGMGTDGHFASIFPDNPDLASLLDIDAPAAIRGVRTAASDYPRVTANLAMLLQAQHLLLLAFGSEKRQLLQQPGELPVAALMNQTRVPLEVYWAP